METEKRLQKLKNKSRIISVFLCICMLLCICSCTNEATQITKETNGTTQTESVTKTATPKNTTDYSEHSFAVHYIDVGQGDAALVVCDDKTMLIDGGKPHASSIIYTYLKNLNIDYLDYIVASQVDYLW